MDIRSDQRVFISAKTGAGKTTFVKRVLYPRYTSRKVFWDIKHENNDVEHTFLARNPGQLAQGIVQHHQSILYQPDDTEPEDFDKVCQIVFNARNIVLFIDETANVTTANTIGVWHKRLMIMGRSRGIGVVSCTQRPRNIHNTIISESEHFFIGRLTLTTDIEKLKPMLGDEVSKLPPTLPYYHWIYTDGDRVVFLKPVQL